MEYTDQYQKYRDMSVYTSTPGERLIMLYDELLKQINRAILHIGKKDISSAHDSIVKAEKIIIYMIDILDFRYPISLELMELYKYLYLQLIESNASKDEEKLQRVLVYVKELKETWQQAETALRQKNEYQRESI